MTLRTYAEIKQLVKDHKKSTSVSDQLVIALIWKESGFKDHATATGSSATGLMQVTKGAVQDVNDNTPEGVSYDHSEMKDAAKNILTCETCLKADDSKYLDCLHAIHA